MYKVIILRIAVELNPIFLFRGKIPLFYSNSSHCLPPLISDTSVNDREYRAFISKKEGHDGIKRCLRLHFRLHFCFFQIYLHDSLCKYSVSLTNISI